MSSFFEFFFFYIFPLLIFIFAFLRQKFSYFEDREIPFVKPKWPMGNLSGVGSEKHLCDAITEVYNACKGKDVICGFYNQFLPIYLVIDRNLAKSVLIKDFKYFVNRGIYSNVKGEPLTSHLFLTKDDQWRFLRHKLMPSFTASKVKGMFDVISEKSLNLIQALNSSESIELRNITAKYTLDVIGSVALGFEVNTLKKQNENLVNIFLNAYGSGMRAQLKFFMINNFPQISKLIGIKFLSKEFTNFIFGVVNDNLKYRNENKDNREDFFNMLIQHLYDKTLKFNEITAQVMGFMSNSTESTSTVISFALFQLSHNQEIQQKLRKEIEEKSINGEITYEALHEMKYLDQVVDETLRMHPTSFLFFREASNDYKVPNSKHIIKKSSRVWISTRCVHYNDEIYQNPDVFDPERFSIEEIEKRPDFSLLGFGDGPRQCIGMRDKIGHCSSHKKLQSRCG